jgi:hypothetical protein
MSIKAFCLPMDNISAIKYLELLLNRTFRAHTSDGRMFLGEFKCTDSVRPLRLLRAATLTTCRRATSY